MKNVRIRVVENCSGDYFWYSICEGRKQLMIKYGYYHKGSAVRYAKAIAKRIGIKYDSEIIKQRGC